MSLWTLVQIGIDFFAALSLFLVFMRLSRQPKDDPRLSRGLQLLQSKISVLEDLSDRTENQVSQLTAILDQKSKEVQAKVQLAEQHVHEIRISMERSLDVAKIFQDKIPHQEIIERQNTIKYVQAARLAHQGLSVEEIANQVDLPKGELEFITKINREQLMFQEDGLPWWAKPEATTTAAPPTAATDAASSAPHFLRGELNHLQFQPTESEPSGESTSESTAAEDPAARLKAEMDLAEQQRLVENLSRLQFEMQSLDQQLFRESSGRDLSEAFESPKFASSSLQRIGSEFKKACDDARRSPLPSLEQVSQQISNLMPQIVQEQAPPPLAVEPVAASAAPLSSAAAAATRTASNPSVSSTELIQARALARRSDAVAKGSVNSVGHSPGNSPSGSPVRAAPTKAAPGEVRRVLFPRIESTK